MIFYPAAYDSSMRAGFLRKLFGLLCVLSAISVFMTIAFAVFYANRRTVSVLERFYFLVSTEENVPASSINAYLSGGAGYVMRYGGKEYAVLSVYFSPVEAENVAKRVSKTCSVAVLPVEAGKLYLTRRADKRRTGEIVGFFKTLREGIRVVSEIAIRAEKGERQSVLKSLLSNVQSVIERLFVQSEKYGKGLSTLLERGATEVCFTDGEIVYSKDVRFLQALLCDAYLQAANNFLL